MTESEEGVEEVRSGRLKARRRHLGLLIEKYKQEISEIDRELERLEGSR